VTLDDDAPAGALGCEREYRIDLRGLPLALEQLLQRLWRCRCSFLTLEGLEDTFSRVTAVLCTQD
jgi:hypothetical protein